MAKYLSTREIQLEELKILLCLVELLDKNDIDYYLYGGTLLGAIRHKGFIPWDDDIDIILTRPNYDKLIKILKNNNCQISENINAIGYELDNNYDWPFIKIINKKIVLDDEKKCDKNLWIDIFVYDAIPENSFIFFNIIKIMRKIFFMKRYDIYGGKEHRKSIYKKILDYVFLIISKPFNIKTLLKAYVNYCKKYSYNSSNFVYDNIWGLNDKRKINKKELAISEYEFEGYEFKSYKNYDLILSNSYGDYMVLPPKDQQITHEFKARRIK